MEPLQGLWKLKPGKSESSDIRKFSESSILIQKIPMSRTKFDYIAISCKTGLPIVSSPSKIGILEYLKDHEGIQESDIIFDLQNSLSWPLGSNFQQLIENFDGFWKKNINSVLEDSSGNSRVLDQLQVNWILRNFERLESLMRDNKDI